ncbi:hypothetical protein NDA16_000641 [Ustilago loliicola]|nr:hypothetical protein NDA16_000641 [Ustilago loliicola]
MQHHIYELGLLSGCCSDIRIRAFGRIYHLHRLVLIQSGFFRAMLCGGYAEDLAAASAAATLSKKHSHRESHASPFPSSSSANPTSTAHKDADSDVVELHFDDPNISRAAFEYCIARLYGDGPKLVLPFWATPSSTHPFSPALTMRLSQSSELQLANLLIDKRSHPATPRFLLSLLATSIYLNIPSVTSQALTLVLCSVTPFTVIQYLRFAIGCGIEGTDLHRSASDEMLHDLDEWDWELEGPARTLEEIARSDPSTSASVQQQNLPSSTSHNATLSDDFSNKLNVTSSSSGLKHASSTSPDRDNSRSRQSQSSYPEGLSGESRSQTPGRDEKRSGKKTAGFRETGPVGLEIHTTDDIAPEYQYGLTADKIGEACVCWFARWGFDIFELECSMERERIIEIETWIRMCREDRDFARLALLRDCLHTGDVDLLHTSMLPRGRMLDPEERMPSPRLRVWSYPSMPSSWVRAIISSDGFFVPSEQHRYEFAKKVVEFRRRQKALINVLDRLIDDWMREDEDKNAVSESSKKAGGATKASNHSAASSDAGDGFGFKAFRRTSSVAGDDDTDAAATPLQEAWNDGVESTTFSPSLDEDEAEYEELFSSGIYYSHMPFAALNKIGADVSPTTGRPYTPLHVLQAALWVSNELRMHIMSSTDDSRRSAMLAALQEAEVAGRDASSVEAPDPRAQDLDGAGELGISSSITQFRDAFESSLLAANSQRRFSRSRSNTPGYMAEDADANMGFGSTSGLGGLAVSPLMLGALGGGKAGLLSKRYYMVPSDDTVRFGDGLMSVVGSTAAAASNVSRAPGSEDGRGNASSAFADDNLGPSGTAAIQLPHTLPINAVIHHDNSNTSTQQRDLSHYYGMANDVATGRELGEFAYRHLSPTSETSARDTSRHFDESDVRRSTAGESGAHSHDPNDEGDGADAESIDSTGMSPERWSGYEPMRVGVEFFGIDKLQEKQRLYSPTFFYAGSVWNLYIQVVKKVKGIQLGIYLHRQSLLEALPQPSAPTPVEGGEQVAPGLSSEGMWPAGPVETPASRMSSQRDRQGSTTPRGTEGGAAATNSSRNSRTAQQQQQSAARNSMFAASVPTVADDAPGGEGNGSFFDTSLTSPVRAGGHGYSASGSTLTMPNGRTITRMGGNHPSSSPLRNNSTNDHFAADTNDPTTQLTASSSSSSSTNITAANLTTASHADPTSLSSPFFSIDTTPTHPSHSSTSANAATTSASNIPPFQPPPIVPLYPSGPSVYSICPLPAIPYRDTRKELRAYFSIHCPSPLGTALTKFSSGPDKFTISQSWGWKSSSLLGTVHLENGDLESGKHGLWYTFRCVCTIGLV